MAEQNEASSKLRELHLRHAEYYIATTAQAEQQYQSGGDGVVAGLARFDQERDQLDAARAWLQAQPPDSTSDRLLLADIDATVHIGSLRYSNRSQRIPQLLCALDAAQRQGDRVGQGLLLGNLGVAYAACGGMHQSINFHEQSLALARELGDRYGEGSALGNLGTVYKELGETHRAIILHQQHLVIARELSDRHAEAVALGSLGIAYFVLGEMRRALDFFEQMLKIARETNHRRREEEALAGLGAIYMALGETRRAIGFFEQILHIAREIGDQEGEDKALGGLSLAYFALGQTSNAISSSKQVLSIAQNIDEPRGEVVALIMLGMVSYKQGDMHRAIEHYEQALIITRQTNNRMIEGQTLGNLGGAYLALGETHRAIDSFNQHLVIARETGDRRSEGSALGNLGIAYAELGETHKAISLYKQQSVIVREIDDRLGEATMLVNLGNAYRELGDTQQARDAYEQALSLAQAIEDLQGIAETHWNLGLLLAQEGETATALLHLEQGLSFHEAIGHPQASGMHKTLAYLRTHNRLPGQTPALDGVESQTNLEELFALLPEALSDALKRKDEAALQDAFAAVPPEQEQSVLQTMMLIAARIHPKQPDADPLERFGELFQMVARVALGETGHQAYLEQMLAHLEQSGWHLSNAVQLMWAGERDADTLTEGLGEQDATLIIYALELIATQEPEVQAPSFLPAATGQELEASAMVDSFLPLLGDIALAVHGDQTARAMAEARLLWLEEHGWHLTEVIQRLWDGERDPAVLAEGLEPQAVTLVWHMLALVDVEPAQIITAESLQIAEDRRRANTAFAEAQSASTEQRTALAQQFVFWSEQLVYLPGAPWAELVAHLRDLARRLMA